VSKAVIIGWIIELAGMVLWLYGYFATGNPSLILIQGKVCSGIRRADHDKPYGLIYRSQAKSLDEN
jgi:hypothetical protein